MANALGIVFFFVAAIILVWWLLTGRRSKPLLKYVCCFFAIFGLVLILKDRIAEIVIKDVLSIKLSADQATADAKDIAAIKQQVENQRTTVDLVATQARTAMQLSGEASNKTALAEQKLKLLDDSIQKANDSLKKLDAATDFTLLIAQAEADDRVAFDRLVELRSSENPRFATLANSAVNRIVNRLETGYWIEKSTLGADWEGIGINPDTNSLEQLESLYFRFAPGARRHLLNYIATANRFPKVSRLDFVVRIIREDVFLSTKNQAMFILQEESKLKRNLLAAGENLAWWEKNRSNYDTNSPTSHP